MNDCYILILKKLEKPCEIRRSRDFVGDFDANVRVATVFIKW